MCTLITLWKCHGSAPLVLALNRDEFLDRPATGIELWPPGPAEPAIVAGRDRLAGGTWFGVGAAIVAALTNHRLGPGRSRTGTLSRGDLVVRALRSSSAAEAASALAALDPAAYGSFHLLLADASQMLWVTNRSGEDMEVIPVEPGLHVLGNYGLDNPADAVVQNVTAAMTGWESLSEPALRERLAGILARGGSGWPCVRMGPYGTRGSSLLWWGRPDPVLLSTDGPPDRSAWSDHSNLLEQLNQT